MKPLFDAYVKSMKEKGLPGEEVLKWCRNYLKTAPVEFRKIDSIGPGAVARGRGPEAGRLLIVQGGNDVAYL